MIQCIIRVSQAKGILKELLAERQTVKELRKERACLRDYRKLALSKVSCTLV